MKLGVAIFFLCLWGLSMPATEEETRKLFEGIDFLGKPTALPLTGTSDIPAGATGLPAPSAPGGMSGFAGGPGGRAPGQGGPDSMGLAKSALDAAYKTGKFAKQFVPAQEGEIGGAMPTQGGITGAIEKMVGGEAMPTQAGDGTAGLVAPEGAESMPFTQALSGMEYFNTPEGLAALGELGINTTGMGAAGGGASGLSGGLGLAGGGAAAASAVLGLIAQLTGNADLGKAAQALGAAGTVAGTAGSIGSALGGSAAAAAAAAPAAGVGVGALGGAGIGALGGAAGAAFAPIAAALLVDSIMQMAGSDEAPNLIGSAMEHRSIAGDYARFVPDLMQNVGQQKGSFDLLQQALPYVQSKEELGRLLNSYRNYLSTTQSAPVEGGADPYSIAKIPGVGPVTHGQQTPGGDFGPRTQQLQDMVDQLLGLLPGERITAGYGEPGGGLEGEPAMRLWQQFTDRGRTAPVFVPGQNPTAAFSPGGEGGSWSWEQPGAAAGFYAPAGMGHLNAPNALTYGSEGYQYKGSGGASYGGADYPEPGKFVGSVSPYWQQIQAQRQQPANPLAARINAMIGGGGDAGTGLAEGMLSEEERRRAGV